MKTKVFLCVLAIPLLMPFAAAVEAAPPLPDLPVVNAPALSLSDALALARTDNVTLRQRQAAAEAADAGAESAQAQTQPSLSTTTYAALGDSSNILTTSPGVMPQNLFAVPAHGFADQDLMLMVPLFTGQKLQNTAAAARAQGQAATLDMQGTTLNVTKTITTDYANAALGQALINAAQARLTAENEQVRITQKKVTTGRLAPVDLLREQAEQADAQQGLLAAQNQAALALVTLRTALGISQASTIILTDTLDTLASVAPSLPQSLSDALSQAEARRPELAAAERQVAAAQDTVKAAQDESAPQVFGVAMGDAMTGQDMNRLGYTVGVTASVPLADGGLRRADVRQARAHLAEAEANAEQARQTVDQDVAAAWLSMQTATAQVTAATAGVTAAQQDYSLADLRYNAGKSTTADRLDALSAFTRAQEMLSQAKAALITSRTDLVASLGIH